MAAQSSMVISKSLVDEFSYVDSTDFSWPSSTLEILTSC